tara:strand:- start:340 stop:555 length:216 start_codon:yes stop_codon:yes gene_type:complete
VGLHIKALTEEGVLGSVVVGKETVEVGDVILMCNGSTVNDALAYTQIMQSFLQLKERDKDACLTFEIGKLY